MNKYENYYAILGITKFASIKEIKSAYYKLSKNYHPDKEKVSIEANNDHFILITEAYKILSNEEKRSEYDSKSKYGRNYDEINELLDFEFNNEAKNYDKKAYDKWKDREQLNIIVNIDDNFDGKIEYERYVMCKKCDGSGKDNSSRIMIKNEKGEVKYFDAIDGCDFCFEENNYIVTKQGYKKISDIKVNDIVLSSSNYERVTHLMSRNYSGEIIDFNVCGLNINGVTPNHKINIVRFKRNKNNRIDINNYEILEIPASDIVEQDFILYKIQNWNPKDNVILPKTHNREEVSIKIDSDFVKFISCYITEGNTRGDRVIVLTFDAEKDKDLIDFIYYFINKIGGEVKRIINEKWGNKVYKIEIYNSQLAKFLKHFCGHLAENKFINNDILGIDDDILLETLIKCDGYIKGNSITYTTISKRLSYQVFHISQKLGYNCSISSYEGYMDNNGINHKKCYRIYMSKTKKMGSYKKIIKEGVCLKVKNISKRKVENVKVYNITVENTHKYTIDGLLVNNCEGSGKWGELDCLYCFGAGKVGTKECIACNGEKRILGKQKLSGISIKDGEKDHKVEFMGHVSKDIPGKVGDLWLIKKEQ